MRKFGVIEAAFFLWLMTSAESVVFANPNERVQQKIGSEAQIDSLVSIHKSGLIEITSRFCNTHYLSAQNRMAFVGIITLRDKNKKILRSIYQSPYMRSRWRHVYRPRLPAARSHISYGK